MRNPRVEVRMGQDFYDALCAFADEYECSPADVLLRGAKALLSKSHRWETGTRGRPYARTRKGVENKGSTGSVGTETVHTETGGGRRSDTHLESARVGREKSGQEGCSK